jgi:glucose-6-phosphate 1-epimerase
MNIANLNSEFGIEDVLEFVPGKGDFIIAEISNQHAQASVSLYAAQVLAYQPNDAKDGLLFLSERAYYADGKAIKGGVPLCWPWFGPDPKGLSRPAHGFARNSKWELLETGTTATGATRLLLGLQLNDKTRALWQGEIEARLEIVVGATLMLRLHTYNHGTEAIELSQALHTYFKVGDISMATVSGLEGKTYIDKVDGSKQKQQSGVITIAGEVDRIYKSVSNPLVINDTALNRKIHIHSSGSHSAVVWNPWKDITAGMADLDDDDYQRFLCVETTNAGEDVISVAAGGKYCLEAEYGIEQG